MAQDHRAPAEDPAPRHGPRRVDVPLRPGGVQPRPDAKSGGAIRRRGGGQEICPGAPRPSANTLTEQPIGPPGRFLDLSRAGRDTTPRSAARRDFTACRGRDRRSYSRSDRSGLRRRACSKRPARLRTDASSARRRGALRVTTARSGLVRRPVVSQASQWLHPGRGSWPQYTGHRERSNIASAAPCAPEVGSGV